MDIGTKNSLTRRVNLKNIIQIDEIENFLSSLLQQSEAQEKKIQHLTKLCEKCAVQSSFVEQVDSINTKLREMSSKLELIEEAATARLSDGIRLSSGELSHLNSLQIEKISKLLETFATSSNVNTSLEILSDRFQREIVQLKEAFTPIEMSSKLSDSFNILNAQIQAINISLQNKMDTMEKTKIETLLSRLEMYEGFKTLTNKEISSIKSTLATHDDEIKLHYNCLNALETVWGEMDRELKKCSQKTETRALAHQLQTHIAELQLCAKIKDLSSLQDTMTQSLKDLGSIRNKLNDVQALQSKHSSCLNQKAECAELRLYVLRTHFDVVAKALGESIDTKCEVNALRILNNSFETLNAEQQRDHEQLTVAMRFVEWFTGRGELYENNLRIIDAHLGKLSSVSHPGSTHIPTQPYQSNVTTVNTASLAATPVASTFSLIEPIGRKLRSTATTGRSTNSHLSNTRTGVSHRNVTAAVPPQHTTKPSQSLIPSAQTHSQPSSKSDAFSAEASARQPSKPTPQHKPRPSRRASVSRGGLSDTESMPAKLNTSIHRGQWSEGNLALTSEGEEAIEIVTVDDLDELLVDDPSYLYWS